MKTYSDYILDYKKYGGFDVRLVCQKEAVFTHRLILSAGSRFLSSILKCSEFEDEVVTILLPDFEPAQVKEMINILYTNEETSPVPPIFSDLQFKDVHTTIRDFKKEECESGDESGERKPINLDLAETFPLSEVKIEIKIEEDYAMQNEILEDISKVEHNIGIERNGSSDLVNNQLQTSKKKLLSKKKRRSKNKLLSKKSLKTAQVKETYICDECNIEGNRKSKSHFYTKRKFFLHQKTHYCKDFKDNFPCNECSYVGTTIYCLETHFLNHHSEETYACEEADCERTFKSLQLMKHHIRNFHKGFMCDRCSYITKSSKQLKLHQQREHDGVKFICDKCGLEAISPPALREHIKTVHEGLRYPCDKCEFVASTKSSFNYHSAKEHRGTQYLCERCSFASPIASTLTSHMKRVHGEAGFKCTLCHFKTRRLFCLKRHTVKIHGEELKNLCQ